jgi:hypothetical protein
MVEELLAGVSIVKRQRMSMDVRQFVDALNKLPAKVIDAARRGADVAGEHVLGDAQQLAPVATGFLQSSATALPAEVHGTRVTKTIGFNANYAVPVHEILTNHHPTGQAKFLETAMRNNQAKVTQFIADEVKRAME